MSTTRSPEHRCVRVPTIRDPRTSLPPPTAESIEEVLGEEAFRLLDRAGLQSRIEVEKRIARIVEASIALSEQGVEQSLVGVVVGEWGLGKSHVARIIRERAARRIRVITIVFDDLVDEVDRLYREKGSRPTEVEAKDAILDILVGGGLPALVVIDEVESLISAASSTSEVKRTAAEAFFDLVKALLNPEISYARHVRGKLHLILLMTPAAFNSLRAHLQERGIGGKLLRRFQIVRLRPLEKHESISLVQAFLEASLGLDIRDAFSDPRIAGVFHEVSGGNPGNIISLLSQVLQAAACPDERCICRITPAMALEALSNAVLVDEAGETYPAVDRYLAQAILEYSGGDPETVILALGSIAPGRVASRAERVLARIGLAPVRVRVTVLGGPPEAGRWLSEASARVCGEDSECRQNLASALSHLIHVYPDGRLAAALPVEAGTLAEWLEYYGWDPAGRVEGLSSLLGAGEDGWLIVPPTRLSRILTVHTRRGVAYVRDPRARERLRERLRSLESSPEEYAERVASGLGLVLEHAMGAAPRGSSVYSWKARYGDVLYDVSLSPDPSLLAGRSPECDEEAIVRLLVHHEEEAPEVECPLHVPIPLPHGIAQRLALMALAYTEERGSLDMALLAEEAEDIHRRLSLEDHISRALPRLEQAGILVSPHSKGLQIALQLMGGHHARAGRLLSDTHRLLVALGGARRLVPMTKLVDAIEVLARATPYSSQKSGKEWCGARVPTFSVLDIKDEPPERLRSLVAQSLNALEAENLAESSGVSYRTRLPGDPVACRLLYLGLQHASKTDLAEKARVHFILPADETLRAYSLERIRARKDAVQHLGLDKASGPWPCRTGAPVWRARPAEPGSARMIIDRLARARRRLRELGVRARHFPTFIVCKQKACKTIDAGYIEATARILDGILSNSTLYNAEEDMARSIHSLLGRYAALADEAVEAIVDAYRSAERAAARLLEAVEKLKSDIEWLAGAGLPRDYASRIDAALDRLAGETRGEVLRAVLSEAFQEAEELVERTSKKRAVPEDIRVFFDFSRCEGHYQPHAYLASLRLDRVRERLEGMANRLFEASRSLEGIRRIITGLGVETARPMLRSLNLPDAPSPEEDPELIAVGLERTARTLLVLVDDRTQEARARAERARVVEELFRQLPPPGELEKRLPDPGQAREVEEWASRLGDGSLASAAREASSIVMDLYSSLDGYEEEYESLEAMIEEGCAERIDECARLARSLDAMARDIAYKADRARMLVEEARRRAYGLVEEEARRLREVVDRAREWARMVATGGGRVPARVLLDVDNIIEDAVRVLGEARSLPPPEAIRVLSAARRSLEESLRSLVPEGLRVLYDVLLAVREKGRVTLPELLDMLERAGWPRERVHEALEELHSMAERSGTKLWITTD